jgi:hypothetical protein
MFQNRYKSILYQEDTYLLELVRYIHLNPLRAKLVGGMDELGKYRFCGHWVFMGKHVPIWQNIETVLAYFGKQIGPARRSYRAFITKGIDQGRRWDLTGGGLILSTGGWSAVKALRKEKVHNKSDERILGNGDFLEMILSKSQEQFNRQYAMKAGGIDLDTLAARVAELLGMGAEQVWQAG